MPTTSHLRKLAGGVTSFESRRAANYIKGKAGYDIGFLPRKTSPNRIERSVAKATTTSREPSSPASPSSSSSAYSSWKSRTTEVRRSYMSAHISREAVTIPEETKARRQKMLEGRRKREELLNAPLSSAEQSSLPSIESTIMDDYPLVDLHKDDRALEKRRNREAKNTVHDELHLHQMLTLHHNSRQYVCTIEGLDSLLEQSIGDSRTVDHASTQTFNGIYNTRRSSEIEAEIYDRILGTAAGEEPGVLEVSRAMS